MASSLDPVHRLARLLLLFYWPSLIAATHWPGLQIPVADDLYAVLATDKLLHFGTFALFTLLVIHARPASSTAFAPNLLVGGLVAAIFAMADEVSQVWFDRTIAGADITANLTGVICVVLSLMAASVPDRGGVRVRGCRVACGLWVVLVGGCQVIVMVAPPTRPLPVDNDVLMIGVYLHGLAMTWLLLAARSAGSRHPGMGVVVTMLAQVAVGVSMGRVLAHGHTMPGTLCHVNIAGMLSGLALYAVELAWRWKRDHKTGPRTGWPPILPPLATPTSGHGPGDDEKRTGRNFVGHAMLVSGLTLVSRVMGLIRDGAMAATFGVSPVSAAFYLAFLVPNLFRRLFGEGALSAAFIPVYTQLLRNDALSGRRLATAVIAVVALGLGLTVFVGEAVLAVLLVQGGLAPDTVLAIRLCMIMLPYMPLICLVALLAAISQVHGRYGTPAAVPIVLNVVWIVGAVAGTAVVCGENHGEVGAIFIVAVAVLVAGVLQLLWQLLATLRVERPAMPGSGTGRAFRQIVLAMIPMLIGVAVFQINVLLDGLLAFFLSPRQGVEPVIRLFGHALVRPVEIGSVAALHWAQRLYQFPLGLFGIAIATAVYPVMATAAAEWKEATTSHAEHRSSEQLADIVRRGLRLTVFIGLPASVGLVLLRFPVTRLIYERGQFPLDDTRLVAGILAGYASAVWAYALTLVVTRAFYAVGNSVEPVRISVLMVLLNVLLNLVLVWPLHAAGLAWSTAFCGILGAALLLFRLRHIVPDPVNAAVRASWIRSAVTTAVMALCLAPPLLLIDAGQLSPAASAAYTLVLVVSGTAVYFLMALALGSEELVWLRHPRRHEGPGA